MQSGVLLGIVTVSLAVQPLSWEFWLSDIGVTTLVTFCDWLQWVVTYLVADRSTPEPGFSFPINFQYIMDTQHEGGSKGDPVQITEGWTIPAGWLHTLTGDAIFFWTLVYNLGMIEHWWWCRWSSCVWPPDPIMGPRSSATVSARSFAAQVGSLAYVEDLIGYW